MVDRVLWVQCAGWAGLACQQVQDPAGEKMPVAIACYGDGAANQGQIIGGQHVGCRGNWYRLIVWCCLSYCCIVSLLVVTSSLRLFLYSLTNTLPSTSMYSFFSAHDLH
jgi:hypothetical protein